MPRYTVARNYAVRLNGHTDVRWPAGAEVELNAGDASWVFRDAPDLLSEVKPKSAKKAASKRGGSSGVAD